MKKNKNENQQKNSKKNVKKCIPFFVMCQMKEQTDTGIFAKIPTVGFFFFRFSITSVYTVVLAKKLDFCYFFQEWH